MHKKTQNQNGSSTLEMLIAMAVLALALTAVITVTFGNQTITADASANNQGIAKAESMLEQARALSRQNLGSVQSIPPTTDAQGFSKKLTVSDIDAFSKLVVAEVDWQPRNQKVELSTILADWQAAAGGDTCSQQLSGDWTHPAQLGNIDIGQNNGGTDVDVFAKKAYVTTDSSSQNKPDFYVVDVVDPNNLTILNSAGLNTGPGLVAVQVSGKYAYVANTSRSAQLQIIDISNPAAPFLAKSFSLPNVTGSGAQGLGNSIYYSNKKVYLGLTKTATGPEFEIIDVSNFLNDPSSSPVLVGSYDPGTTVNDIIVKNGIAYIATPMPGTNPATQENLSVLNVSDPANITRINTFTYAGASTMAGQSLYLSSDGNTLYFGRGGANPSNNPDFFVLNVSNPATGISVKSSKYIGSTPNAITIRSNLAFMVTSDTNLGFQIWDINNLNSAYGSLNVQQTSTGGMDCEGNVMYIAQRSNKALQIIGPGN